jgi:para-nitrobenzyl esterase
VYMARHRKLSTAFLFLAAAALAGLAVASAPALAAGNGNGPTVSTSDGPVRGFVNNSGVNTFLGIPYAAPPVGSLRWMPPQPTSHHSLLDATQFASNCPQVTELGAFAGPSSTNEDCLYVNVFTPSLKGSNAVLVWIHGGGYVDGESTDYDASKLATGGPLGKPTVVVTINYRLGLFGFLSESHLNSEGHPWGNYGILDIQAALRWVRANVAAFGGDPTRVALGGQSAGAGATQANVLSPLAAGLFNRAINESSPSADFLVAPPSTPSLTSAQVALNRGAAFATAAGCSDATCLRNLSAARILQLQGTPNANGPFVTGLFVDGTIVPTQPEVAWQNGSYNRMPMLGGAVHDESNFTNSITEYFSGPPQAPLTASQYTSLVNATFVPPLYTSGAAAAVLGNYPPGSNPDAAYARAFTDPGKCRVLHVVKEQSTFSSGVYSYDFTYLNAPYYFPQMPNPASPTGYFQPLAAHTIDIQFLFQNWHGGQLGVNISQDAVSPANNQPRELQGSEVGLSDQLVAAWTNFAATGNPNGTGAPLWPVTTPSSGTFLNENIPTSVEAEAAYSAAYQCSSFWNALLLYPVI